VIYHDVPQGDEAWFRLRMGVPTASCFDSILTPAKGELSKSSTKYVAELIGEQLATFLPANVQTYTSRAMDWGQQTEAEARRFYSMERDIDVSNGGFCLHDSRKWGASPDGLIGLTRPVNTEPVRVTGALELKCPQPGTHVEYLMDGKLPLEYRWQVHGHLIVTGAAWCDFLSYCPGLPPLLVRVEPGPDTDKLRVALERFHEQYQAALARVRGAA
jgi:hypothetical protein